MSRNFVKLSGLASLQLHSGITPSLINSEFIAAQVCGGVEGFPRHA